MEGSLLELGEPLKFGRFVLIEVEEVNKGAEREKY